AKLIEKQAMGGVLLRFDALDDPVFDVVEGNAVGGRLFPGAAVGASRCQRHLARELIDVQGGKDLQRRPIVMLLPLQPVKEASKRGPLRRFHHPHVGQSLRPTPLSPRSNSMLRRLRFRLNRAAIWAEVVRAGRDRNAIPPAPKSPP